MPEPIVETLAGQEPTETAEVEQPTLAGGEETPAEQAPGSEGKETKAADKPVVPEKYEIKVPEGMELDAAMLEAFTPVFKELGITQEQAQKLAEAYAPLIGNKMEEAKKQALKDYQDIVEGWKKDTIKELGLESAKQLAFAARARNKFGDEKFKAMINETGIGNHPALVRFLINVGKTISEDKFVDSTKPGGTNPMDVMYPTMKK